MAEPAPAQAAPAPAPMEFFEMIELVEPILQRAIIQVSEEDIARAIPLLVRMLMVFPAPQRQALDVSTNFWNYLNEKIWECSGNKQDFSEHYSVYRNFCLSNSVYSVINLRSKICRSIELLDRFIALGFIDGSVEIFRSAVNYQGLVLHRIYDAYNRQQGGPRSWSVVGIVLKMVLQLEFTFGCIDGNIFQGDLSRDDLNRLYQGNVITDGSMIGFTGNRAGYYVAIYAGVPDRSFRVWNSRMEIIYIGGNFTNLDEDAGIQMYMNPWDPVTQVNPGRVLMIDNIIIGCTNRQVISFGVSPQSVTPILNYVDFGNETAIVQTLSSSNQSFIVATTDLFFTVRRIQSFEVTHRIRAFQAGGAVNIGVHKKYLTILGFTTGHIFKYDSQRAQIAYDHHQEVNRRLSRQHPVVQHIMALATNYKYLIATTPGVLHIWVY